MSACSLRRSDKWEWYCVPYWMKLLPTCAFILTAKMGGAWSAALIISTSNSGVGSASAANISRTCFKPRPASVLTLFVNLMCRTICAPILNESTS
jgi:hypothetical protein